MMTLLSGLPVLWALLMLFADCFANGDDGAVVVVAAGVAVAALVGTAVVAIIASVSAGGIMTCVVRCCHGEDEC